jgi:hypothetical protein
MPIAHGRKYDMPECRRHTSSIIFVMSLRAPIYRNESEKFAYTLQPTKDARGMHASLLALNGTG